jgi:carbonic anhydrase
MQILKLLQARFLSKIAIVLSTCLAILLLTGSLLPSWSIPAAWSNPAHWGYEGEASPENWGKLSPEFASCEIGKAQSPINFQDLSIGSPANIKFDYHPSPLEVVNNGHSIQVNYTKGSSVTIDDKKYALLQFHFHSPSEHQINGQNSPMELHLVHRLISENGESPSSNPLVVLGVMLDQGAANPSIAEVWQNITAIGTTKKVSTRLINASDLLPKVKSYFSYDGSLTTPPCSEGVKWQIFTQPLSVSPSQIATFSRLYPKDARPVQPLNARMVELHL